MPTQTLIDNETATLKYYPEDKIVHHQFHKFIFGQAFQDVLTTGLEAFRRHGAQKWLSDDRGNSAVHPDDTTWAQNIWAPAVIAAGWKYWAVVMPGKVIGQMNMRRWIDFYAEKGVTVQVFSDPDQAMMWLKTCP